MDRITRIEKVKQAMLAMQRRAWEQGVAAQALLELGEHDLVVLLAKDAVVNQLKDGRLGLNEGQGPLTDPAANGEPLLFAARRTHDPTLFAAADKMLEFLLYKAPRTRGGILYHNYIENMIWVDAFYMAPPFLVAAGHPQEAMKQVLGYHRILFDPQAQLYYHVWDEDRQAFERKLFWGVGNGWAAAGMARVSESPAGVDGAGESSAPANDPTIIGRLPAPPATGRFVPRYPRRSAIPSSRPTPPRLSPTRFIAASRLAGSTEGTCRPLRNSAWRSTKRWTSSGSSRGSAAHRTSKLPARRPKARPSSC